MENKKIAEGKTKITFQVSYEEREILRELSKKSGMGVSAYVREILFTAMEKGTIFSRRTIHQPLFSSNQGDGAAISGNGNSVKVSVSKKP